MKNFVFGMVAGWILNSMITQGRRLLEIKKLRQEMKSTASKVGKLEKQNQRIGFKKWLNSSKLFL